MKKQLIFAIALFAGACQLLAKPLTPEQALDRVPQQSVRFRAPGAFQTLRLADRIKPEGSDTDAFYIFSSAGNTLFVSADDCVKPLLGEVDGAYTAMDKLPQQLQWWLSEYGRQIEWQRSHRSDTQSEFPVKAKRNASRSAIAPMVKTKWNQDAPYNNQCPQLKGQTTYTGCVATALAQVMAYHKWPAATKGGVFSYQWQNGKQELSYDFNGVKLDWANMLDTYTDAAPGTSVQRNAVATLMKACGYGVEMNYGGVDEGGSGAVAAFIRRAVVDNFDYDDATRYCWRDFYDDDTWENMVYESLSTCGPILYCGSGTGGGHAFVCDGYRTDGYYHFNWGWGGNYDGYFLLDALEPTGQGIGGNEDNFNYNQDAVFNMKRPDPSTPAAKPAMSVFGMLSATMQSSDLMVMTASDDGGFINLSGINGTFDLGAMVEGLDDREGINSVSVTATDYDIEVWGGFTMFPIQINSAYMPIGRYTVTPAYRVSGDADWIPMQCFNDGPSFVTIEVSSDDVKVVPNAGSENLPVTVGDIKLETALVPGEVGVVSTSFTNPNDASAKVVMFPILCDIDGNVYFEWDPVSINLAAGATRNVTYTKALSSYLTPGQYILAIVDESYNVYKAGYCNVTDGTAEEQDVTVTSVTPSEPYTAFEESTVTVSFLNNSSTLQRITVSPYIATTDWETVIAQYPAATVVIGAGGTVSKRFTTNLPNVPAGTYTMLICELLNGSAYVMSEEEITVNAAEGEIELTSATGADKVSPGDKARITYNISSTYNRIKSIELVGHFCEFDEDEGLMIVESLPAVSIDLKAGGATEYVHEFTVPDLDYGRYYYVVTDRNLYTYTDEPKLVEVVDKDNTGINGLECDTAESIKWFDINGRSADSSRKGLLIRRGEKIMR